MHSSGNACISCAHAIECGKFPASRG